MSDKYGKCTFPDCGCPESRLCMADDGEGANLASLSLNRAPSSSRSEQIAKERIKGKLKEART